MKAVLIQPPSPPPPPSDVMITMTSQEAEYIVALVGGVANSGYDGPGRACAALWKALSESGVPERKFDKHFMIEGARLLAKPFT